MVKARELCLKILLFRRTKNQVDIKLGNRSNYITNWETGRTYTQPKDFVKDKMRSIVHLQHSGGLPVGYRKTSLPVRL